MSKALSRNLYLISIGIVILAIIFTAYSIPGGTTTTNANGVTTTTPGNGALFAIAIILYIIAAILSFIAWVGALIRMAELRQWVWFIFLLIFSGITMLFYIFIGPTTPADQPAAYQPYQQPGMLGPSQPIQPQQPPQPPQAPYGGPSSPYGPPPPQPPAGSQG